MLWSIHRYWGPVLGLESASFKSLLCLLCGKCEVFVMLSLFYVNVSNNSC